MNRLVVIVLFCLFGVVSAACGDSIVTNKGAEDSPQGGTMHINVRANGNITLFELNDSQAAKALYDQLPLTVEVEPYSDNEMIFYPPKKLATDHTPMANAKAGTLAYYAPWGDVVMFYKDFGSAGGLYELGRALSGAEHIRNISGTIRIEKSD
jgi:hypothetical protein